MYDASLAERLKKLKTLTERIDSYEHDAGKRLKDGEIDEDTYNEVMQALSESRNIHEESINRLEQALNDPRVQVVAKKG